VIGPLPTSRFEPFNPIAYILTFATLSGSPKASSIVPHVGRSMFDSGKLILSPTVNYLKSLSGIPENHSLHANRLRSEIPFSQEGRIPASIIIPVRITTSIRTLIRILVSTQVPVRITTSIRISPGVMIFRCVGCFTVWTSTISTPVGRAR